MTNAKEQKTKDLREKLANPATQRWYDNIVLHISSDAKELFMPMMDSRNIKVVMPDAANEDNGYKKLFGLLKEHSLLIYGEVCDSSEMEYDICISVNDLWSRPSDFVIGMVLCSFKRMGYKIAINKPFNLVLAPRLDFDYHALTIVVNKRVFMDEKTQETNEDAKLIRQNLTSLYGILYKYWEEK